MLFHKEKLKPNSWLLTKNTSRSDGWCRCISLKSYYARFQ